MFGADSLPKRCADDVIDFCKGTRTGVLLERRQNSDPITSRFGSGSDVLIDRQHIYLTFPEISRKDLMRFCVKVSRD